MEALQMNLLEYLHIKTVKTSKQQVVLSLEVDKIHKQPYGLLHGGINAVLAETAASMLANLNAPAGFVAVGVNINTNHLSAVKAGRIETIAEPIKIGTKIQVLAVTTISYPEKIKTSYSTVTTTFLKE
ncbi:ComA operon protein 2 [Liquorilactobacillus mali]|uniref:ComA operon protein 2 n=2 Tax=Liquorilactobacillus mali TaxID=1618 RepID=A0A0R2FVS8_9LACO|nr:ComA operon protein 2 [Liquorilactobacillus mali]